MTIACKHVLEKCIFPRFLPWWISLFCRTGTLDILAYPCAQGAWPTTRSIHGHRLKVSTNTRATKNRNNSTGFIQNPVSVGGNFTSCQLPGQPYLPDPWALAEGGGQVPLPQKMKNMNRTENKQPREGPREEEGPWRPAGIFTLARRRQSREPLAPHPGCASADK